MPKVSRGSVSLLTMTMTSPRHCAHLYTKRQQSLTVRRPVREIDMRNSSQNENIDWSVIYREQQPVVLKGLVRDWPSVSDSERKWENLQELGNRASDNTIVSVEFGENYMAPGVVRREVSFKSFVQFLQQSVDAQHQQLIHSSSSSSRTQAGADDEATPTIPRVYLAQQSIDEIPEVAKDFIAPSICYTGKGSQYGRNVWMCGPAGSVSPCHHDPFQNLLCQVFGAKDVTLFSPEERDNLYPAINTVQRNTSLVDIESPDLTAHPRYATAAGGSLFTRLQAGDALFIPFKWWHFCKSSDTSASVNFWWL